MTEQKKNLIFRLISSGMCLISIGISIYLFCICMLSQTEESLWFHMVGIAASAILALVEMIILFKNIKKELIIEYIIFNDNKTINKMGLVVVIIMTIIGLGLSIMSICFICGFAWDEVSYYAAVVILSCSLLLFLNCILYYIYILMFREHKLTLDDLGKVIKDQTKKKRW